MLMGKLAGILIMIRDIDLTKVTFRIKVKLLRKDGCGLLYFSKELVILRTQQIAWFGRFFQLLHHHILPILSPSYQVHHLFMDLLFRWFQLFRLEIMQELCSLAL